MEASNKVKTIGESNLTLLNDIACFDNDNVAVPVGLNITLYLGSLSTFSSFINSNKVSSS